MTGSRAYLHIVSSRFHQSLLYRFGAAFRVFIMAGIRADGGNPQQFQQLVKETVFVLGLVIFPNLHF